MTTTRRANEIWMIGNPKSDLNASCLHTNGELLMKCVTFITILNTVIQKFPDSTCYYCVTMHLPLLW